MADDRAVLGRLLTGELNDFAMGQVRVADAYIDGALDVLEMEEPSLLHYLEGDPDIDRIHLATMTAIRSTLYRDARKGMDFDESMRRVGVLVFRELMTAAYRAVYRERPDVHSILPPMMAQGVEQHEPKPARAGVPGHRAVRRNPTQPHRDVHQAGQEAG